VSWAARQAGLSEYLFIKAAERGDIPIEIIQVGERGTRFVRVCQLREWLSRDGPASLQPSKDQT
jgi:hypothetical protein